MFFQLPGEGRTKGRLVAAVINAGDVLFWRSDVEHGGMPYDVRHWRAHFYLEPACWTHLVLRNTHEGDGLALHLLERHKEWEKRRCSANYGLNSRAIGIRTASTVAEAARLILAINEEDALHVEAK